MSTDILRTPIGSNIGLGNTALTNSVHATQQRAYADTLGRRSDVAELRITRAANGLIVSFDGGYNAVGETFVAANLKEATDIITAQLASKLLEQT
jgi:hypothetical protein